MALGMLVVALMLLDRDGVMQAMKARAVQLDEAFLSHTHACMRKAADDGLNGRHALLDYIGMLACWSYGKISQMKCLSMESCCTQLSQCYQVHGWCGS